MHRWEKTERRAYIRFIVSLLRGMSTEQLRRALEAVLAIAHG